MNSEATAGQTVGQARPSRAEAEALAADLRARLDSNRRKVLRVRVLECEALADKDSDEVELMGEFKALLIVQRSKLLVRARELSGVLGCEVAHG